MATSSIGFRANEEDQRIIRAVQREDESTTDVLRRGLRLLARQTWVEQARSDAERLAADEDLSTEADAW